MIDWWMLAANALWILGCSLALAVFSFAYWQADVLNEKFLTQLDKRQFQIPLYLAGVLFAAGLASTSPQLWIRLLWGVIGIYCLIQGLLLMRQTRPTP